MSHRHHPLRDYQLQHSKSAIAAEAAHPTNQDGQNFALRQREITPDLGAATT